MVSHLLHLVCRMAITHFFMLFCRDVDWYLFFNLFWLKVVDQITSQSPPVSSVSLAQLGIIPAKIFQIGSLLM